MASADCMVDLMSSWIYHRQNCAEKLSTMATDRQSVREITELLKSSDAWRRATEEDEHANQICTKIQDQFPDVKQKSPPEDPKDVNQHMMEEILKAMAKRNGFSASELDFGTVTNVVKSTIEENARAEVDFQGEVFSQKDTCQAWEAQIQSGHVTDASQSLRDLAKGILKVVEALQQTLNCISKVFEELKEVLACLEDPNHEDRKRILLEFAAKQCRNDALKEWLKDKEGSDTFISLVNLYVMMKAKICREYNSSIQSDDFDIIFVAHGEITSSMISADDLLHQSHLPSSNLQDVLLYAPWNCAIDATVAYGIARGSIQYDHRHFGCGHGCPIPHDHIPSPVPLHWNSMRESRGLCIPEILVTSLKPHKDRAWQMYLLLKQHNPFSDRDRVVIPFTLQEGNKYKEVQLPFTAVTTALSIVMLSSTLKPQLHLAACLGKAEPETHLDVPYLEQQYSCAPDGTAMWSSEELNFPTEEDEQLFKNLKDVFG